MLQSLDIDRVTMTYAARTLFQDVSVSVTAGRCLVVTGVNGAGKSTFLKIIAGLVRPESGQVRYLDGDTNLWSERAGLLGYAAPSVNAYTEMTGFENLAFFARLRGLDPADTVPYLARVGLGRARGRDLVSSYSSGMRQRLKLAISLLGDPPLLVWDEPTVTLDTAGNQLVEEIVASHLTRNGLLVIATNDPGEAERWGDSRLHLVGG